MDRREFSAVGELLEALSPYISARALAPPLVAAKFFFAAKIMFLPCKQRY